MTPAQTQRNEEQIALLTEKINKLVEEAEQSGIQGNVEQAQGLMRLCDQLKEERETLRKSNDNSHYNQVRLLVYLFILLFKIKLKTNEITLDCRVSSRTRKTNGSM